MFGDEVERLQHFDPLTGELIADDLEHVAIWPATHYNVKEGTIDAGVAEIGRELNERCEQLETEGKQLESHRLRQRTQYDHGDAARGSGSARDREYSRILDGRKPGDRPYCLIDYFPKDFVCFIDESHQTVPQIGGMHEGDRSRKQTLVDYGFPAAQRARQPSADIRRVPFDHTAAAVRLGDARRVRAARTRPVSWSRSSARPGSSIRSCRCVRRAIRSMT